jgi:hypothetical protein
MNRKNIAIVAILVALALSAAALTMPTRQALAWGSFGSTKVDQRINQLNNCTNQSPDNNYQQSSYDPNSDNKPSTDSSRGDSLTSSDHGNTANQATGNANNQTSENHGNIKNQVSGEDNSDNKQPNSLTTSDHGSTASSSGNEKHNNHLVICVNKANNLAQFN